MKKVLLMSDLDESSLIKQSFGENPENNTADALSTAGTMLRHAREAAGLHIASLAVSLKVPVKKLEALEADQFDLLPDAVFVRALASSVCRNLKIDPQPVLARLPQTIHPSLASKSESINAPFRAFSDTSARSGWAQVSRTAVWGGVALLLATLVLVFLPNVKSLVSQLTQDFAWPSATNEAAKAPANVSSNQDVVIDSSAQTTPVAANPVVMTTPNGVMTSPSVSSSATGVAQAALSPTAVVSPASPTVSGGTPVVMMAPAQPASASLALPSSDIVVFTATSQSWVEVTDSRGQVILRKTLGTGEVASASGALPLAAVVGRADATQVHVRGKALDLAALAKNNVARFEVK